MKLKISLITVFVITAIAFSAIAQDNRLLKTKVADILAFLPTDDNAQAERLFVELSNLGEDGIKIVTDQVQPNGVEAGVPYRYGVSLLTHFSTNALQKAVIEKVYLYALANATNTEVKAYFIDNLKWIGSDVSIKPLSAFISDKDLFNQAISAIQIIGTPAAHQALVNALNNAPVFSQAKLIQALGELKEASALPLITKAASSTDAGVKKQALWSLSLLGSDTSSPILVSQAKAIGFKNDPSEATNSLIEYLHDLKNPKLIASVSKTILDNTTTSAQQHYRLAALEAFCGASPTEASKILVKELNKYDAEYRKEVLNIAVPFASNPNDLKIWEKEYKKSTGEVQAGILSMMAKSNRNDGFITMTLLPALASTNASVRPVAAQEIAFSRIMKFAPNLIDYVVKTTDEAELAAAKSTALQLIDKDNTAIVVQKLDAAATKNKVALIQILAERRAVSSFVAVLALINSSDASVKSAALTALPRVSSTPNVPTLLTKLSSTDNQDEVKALQASIIASVGPAALPQINAAYSSQKMKLVPVLPYLNDKGALDKVTDVFNNGSEADKQVAFDALQNWQNSDAVRFLLSICKNGSLQKYNAAALAAGVKQISASAWPDDEKLLFLRDFISTTSDKAGKTLVLRAASNVRTFLSLVFVSSFLDDSDVSAAASRAAMQLALPTGDGKPGMTGSYVRLLLEKIQEKLVGEDSQYDRLDVAAYLGKLPFTKGYESIFNGKDLTGWHGLVENPILRSKMSREILTKKQKDADAKVSNNWSVSDGMIVFSGEGANLATVRPYGDFEMLVDWKISKNGDSGIYLRGSPQIQIWDIARADAGAQVGSGGLYNNQKEKSTPLVVADNPVGEWNTFRIKMIGDKVTVYLNGILVVDNVVMENYWDRTLPIFTQEAIELQAHGTDLAFRNLYVKELNTTPYSLTDDEKKNGFQLLFNGKDLDLWQGNKTEYVIEDNAIAFYPTKESHGNIGTVKEYSNFIFRFEFQLTPAANNGIGIHAPMEGDAGYLGKEVQVLDDSAPAYAKLEPWQYHGSIYGVIPSKRGFQKPVGDWNQEEIEVKGDYFKVTLNGTVITEGDLKKASKTGTLDHKPHPGIDSHLGPIQFLGHGTVVRFRDIRVKEL